VSKKTKSVKKASKRQRIILLLSVTLIVFLFLTRGGGKNRASDKEKIKQEVTQLEATENFEGFATAARSYHKGEYRLSLTAFLTKYDEKSEYEVQLIGDSMDPKTIVLGVLLSAGDAFVLNYESSNDYSRYNQIVVISKNLKSANEIKVLEGNFQKSK